MISKSSVQLKVFENIKVDAFLSLKLSEVFVQTFCFISTKEAGMHSSTPLGKNIIANPALRKKYPYSELFLSECGNIRARITPNTDTFHAVLIISEM